MSSQTSDAVIRIVHVQLLPLLTGVQRVTLDILSHLDESAYARHVIASADGPFTERARRIGCTVHICQSLVRPIRPCRDALAFFQLRRLFRAIRPDIVHTHSSKPGVIGRLAAASAGVPGIVHTVHGYAFDDTTPWLKKTVYVTAERLAGNVTTRLVVVNEEESGIATRYRLAKPGRIVKIANGSPDVQRAYATQRARILKDTGFPDTSRLIGMVGRLWPQKNATMFLDAAKPVLTRVPDARFVLIGDGPDRARLERDVNRMGIAGRVAFLGWRDDARELMGGLDIFVQTSHWEGCSLSMLEAMAHALPIVATNVRGVRELIEDGDSGILVEPGDVDALAAAVAGLLGEPNRMEALGSAAFKRRERCFSYADYIASYKRLYAGILHKEPPPEQERIE